MPRGALEGETSGTGDGDVKNAALRHTMCAAPTFPDVLVWHLVMG